MTPTLAVVGAGAKAVAVAAKAAVLRDLAAVAEREEILYDPRDLVRSLEEREALCSTGLTGGVAIVHPRHHDPYIASESFLILARAAHPIWYTPRPSWDRGSSVSRRATRASRRSCETTASTKAASSASVASGTSM